ncbi:hypothetical protein UlMin_023326 [Ulmus minor]
MDGNGINWVGNIYQKFEAMCLEVEEIMYQDTVKYVEGQVQNVGESVKKFYSDVMQEVMLDLLPPSSMDPEKVSPCGVVLQEDSDNAITKKPNANWKKEPIKAEMEQLKRISKVTVDSGKDVGHESLGRVRANHDVDNSCRPSGDFVKGACPDKMSPIEATFAKTHTTESLSRASSSFHEFANENHEASCDKLTTSSTTYMDEDIRSDSTEGNSDEIENASEHINNLLGDFRSSNTTKLVEKNGKKMGVSSSGVISAESNEISLKSGAISLRQSSQNEEVQYDKYSAEEAFVSNPGKSDWSFDTTEDFDITEHGTNSHQQSNKAKLDESCVLVNEDELRCLLNGEGKSRLFKKKIREVLYSRMRSARKKEYEQLALRYGDDSKLSEELEETLKPTLVVGEKNKLPSHDSCESEWELL